MWRRSSESCHCSACEVEEIKSVVGSQRCELDIQKRKLSQLEAKMGEQNLKQDKETSIFLRAVNKQAKQIRSLRQENQEIHQTLV